MDNFTILENVYSISELSDLDEEASWFNSTMPPNLTGVSTELDNSILQSRATHSRNLMDINYRVRIYLTQPAYIIALILGFIGISFNILSILALFQIRNRINTHYRLIISLALSDTLIGTSIVMYIINKVVHTSYFPGLGPWDERLKSRCLVVFIKALNTTSLNISLLNLMGMSIDHYTAITKPLRYHKLMGKNRARLMIIILWFIAGICGFSDLFSGIKMYKKYKHVYNYCELVWITEYQEEFSVLIIAFLCLFVMLFIYIRIYWKVKRHRTPGEIGQMNVCRKREERRNKKALITTLLILGSFVLCWLPTCLFQIILMVVVKLRLVKLADVSILRILKSSDKYLFDVLLLNCICDPIIYTVRCYEVRLGYKRLWGKFFRTKVTPHSRSTKRCSFKTSFMTLPNVDRGAPNEWAMTVINQNGTCRTVHSSSSNSKSSE